MKPVVVTMVTDPMYAEYASKLLESCERHGLECRVIRRADRGSWIENVAQKPSVIRVALSRVAPGRGVLWIDADAQVMREPTILFDTEHDFAIHKRHRRGRTWQPVGRTEPVTLPDGWEGTDWFLTGTVYVADSELGRDFIARWCKLASEQPRAYQQLLPMQAWCDIQPDTEWLPIEYCAIKTMDRVDDPVISHDLASCRIPNVVRT